MNDSENREMVKTVKGLQKKVDLLSYSDDKQLTPSFGSDRAFGMAGGGFFERSLIVPCRPPKNA